MNKNVIIPWLFLAPAVFAKDLPENFDFRKNPAYINLEASPAQRAEAERLILE